MMRKLFSIALFALLTNFSFAAPDPNWTLVQSGTVENLTDVIWVDLTTAWVVGNAGTVLKSTDGGKSWQTISIGTGENLRSISFSDTQAAYGVIVGDNGKIYHTANSGDSWNTAVINSGTPSFNFTGVAFNGGDAVAVSEGGDIYTSNDFGQSWDFNTNISTTTPNIWDIGFSQSWGDFYAPGDNGNVIKGNTTFGDEFLGSAVSLRAITLNGLYVGGDGGQIWEFSEGWSPSIYTAPNDIRGMEFANGNMYVVSKTGEIWVYDSQGTAFKQRQSNTTFDLNKIEFNDADLSLGLIVGLNGVILRTGQGGLCSYINLVLTPIQPTCFGGVDGGVNLSGPGLVEPNYTWDDASFSTTANLSGVGIGTYSVTVDDGGCIYKGSATVTEPTEVQVSVALQTNVTCKAGSDGSADMTVVGGSGPYDYSWTNSAITEDITGLTAGTYGLTAIDQSGCSAVQNVTITEPSNVISSIGADQLICHGGDVTLSVTGGSTYQWEPSASLDNATIQTPTASPTIDTYYRVTATDGSGCVDAATIFVGVHAEPEIGANSGTICAGENILLTGVNGFVETDRFDFWEDQSSHNYSYFKAQGSPVDLTACFNGNLDVHGDRAIDLGDFTSGTSTITIDANVPANVDDVRIKVMAVGDNQTQIQVTLDGSVSETLPANAPCDWQELNFSGMASYTGDAVVQIEITHIGTPNNEGITAIQVLATPVDNAGYEWKDQTTTTIATVPNVNVSPVSSTSYDLTYTDGNGCKASVNSSVTVNALPAVDAGVDQDICDGENAALSGSGAISYTWTSDGSGAFSPNASSPTASYIPSSADISAGTVTLTLTGTDGQGCQANDDVVLTIHPLPAADAGVDQAVCENQTAQLGATGGVQYQWDNIGSLDNGTIAAPVATPTATTNYGVTVTDANGCIATDQMTVTVNALPVVDAGVDVAICDGEAANLAVSGALSYQWDNVGTLDDGTAASPNATPTTTTNYSVTGTDVNGCINTDAVLVTVNALPVVSAGSDQSICMGGSASFLVSGALTYSWSSDGTGSFSPNSIDPAVAYYPSAADASTGTVNINLVSTSVDGCQSTDDVVVTVNPLPVADAGFDQTICAGQTAQLSASGGVTYNWDNSGSLDDGSIFNPVATPVTTTNYSVFITDANGCLDNDQITVTVNALPIVNAGLDTAICANEAANLSAAGAVSYQWDNVGTLSNDRSGAPIATPITTTNYSVTGTDVNGCSSSDQVMVTVNSLPSPSVADQAICQGGVQALDAGVYAAYAWSTAATTQVINVSAAGTYQVTVSDVNGCSGQANSTITENANPITSGGNDFTLCAGENTTFGLSSATGTYLWSPTAGLSDPNALNPTAAPSATTYYTLTVTDANGCVGMYDVDVNVNDNPVSTMASKIICADQTATLTPAVYPQYVWSTGETSTSISTNVAGLYTVTITDVNGCQSTDTAEVTVYALPQPSLLDTAVCEGDSYEFNPGAFASYNWSLGSSEATVALNTATSFTVTVTDVNGCEGSTAGSLQINANPIVDLSNQTICGGETYSADAGNGSATYLWSTGATTAVIGASLSGTYGVTTTDENGCVATGEFVLGLYDTPDFSFDANPIICQGEPIELVPAFNVTPAEPVFVWNNNETTSTLIVGTAELFSLTVTDNTTGCRATNSVSPTVTIPPVADLGNDTTVCEGGSIVLSAGTGTSYLWSNGSTTSTINANATGTYWATLTNGTCTSSDTVNVSVAAPIDAQIAADVAEICPGEQATITVAAGYTYSWSNGTTAVTNTVTTPGAYSVTLTDGLGCTEQDAISIGAKSGAVVDLGPDQVVCPSGLATIATAASGTYLWSTGATTQTIDVDAEGTYFLDVTDQCQGSDTVVITFHNQPTFDIPNDAICSGTSITIDATSTGMETYQWFDGATNVSLTVTPESSTDYFLDAWDSNGCFATDTFAIAVNPAAVPVLNDTAICFGQTYFLNPGDFDTYVWYNSSTAQTLSGQAFLDVNASVTVTDANGCSGNVAATVTVSGDMSVTTSTTTVSCFQGVNGTATAVVTGGIAPFTYFWNNGNKKATADSLRAEQYSVLVADAIGCTANGSVVVTQPEELVLSETELIINATCGESNGKAVLGIAGGTLPYQFQWSNGATDQQVINVPAGVYVARVQDSKGCLDSLAIAIVDIDGPVVNVDSVYHSSCNQPDGEIFTTVTGVGPFEFLWTNNSTLQDQSNLYPGKYGLKVTDDNGCVGGAQVRVETDGVFRPVVQGTVMSSLDASLISEAKVTLIEYAADPGVLPKFRSTQVDTNGFFKFDKVWVGEYILLVTPDTIFFPKTFKTFYPNVPRWDSAMVFAVNCSDTTALEVFVKKQIVLNGKASIKGQIVRQLKSLLLKNGSISGEPIPGIDVSLEQIPGGVVAQTQTDEDGLYQFDNVPAGDYQIFVDIPGLPMEQTYDVTIADAEADTAVVELDFLVDTTQSIYIAPTVDAVAEHVIIDGVEMVVYPNPFKQNMQIQFDLTQAQDVYLEITNALGQTVEVLQSGKVSAGTHTINWSAATAFGSGVVLLRGYIGQQSLSKVLLHQE